MVMGTHRREIIPGPQARMLERTSTEDVRSTITYQDRNRLNRSSHRCMSQPKA
jgi:hypothetical protein